MFKILVMSDGTSQIMMLPDSDLICFLQKLDITFTFSDAILYRSKIRLFTVLCIVTDLLSLAYQNLMMFKIIKYLTIIKILNSPPC